MTPFQSLKISSSLSGRTKEAWVCLRMCSGSLHTHSCNNCSSYLSCVILALPRGLLAVLPLSLFYQRGKVEHVLCLILRSDVCAMGPEVLRDSLASWQDEQHTWILCSGQRLSPRRRETVSGFSSTQLLIAMQLLKSIFETFPFHHTGMELTKWFKNCLSGSEGGDSVIA